MRRQQQLPLAKTAGWGGARKGAGRPPIPGRRQPVPHRSRAAHRAAHPIHLTLRARAGLPSLRAPRLFERLRECIRATSRTDFRIVHFSVQGDHLLLMVEAQDERALSSGARGLSIRAAHAINDTLARKGAVWGDRYHARPLPTPRETRHAIVYVLMNFRKHRPADRRKLDPCSSAPWFDGFRTPVPSPAEAAPTWKPRTWLAATGWRRHGLIHPAERPKPKPSR